MQLDAIGDAFYAGDEPHYMLAAQSWAEDRSPDVLDEYRERSYSEWYPYALEPQGTLTAGRLDEPFAPGLPLLAAPAYALGGARAVELLIALFAAAAGALGYLLALRLVPDPWATVAALAGGLSPPALAYATAIYPDAVAAAALAGAALLAAHVATVRPRRREVLGLFALLGTVPWLGPRFLPAAAVVGWFAFRAVRRAHRKLLALIGAEVAFFSVVLAIGFNEAIYGGPTHYAAGDTGTGAGSAGDYAERVYRFAALLIDREFGLLRWAPVFALALVGAWYLYRGGRTHLAKAILGLREEEDVGRLCAIAIAVQLAAAVLLAPTLFGFEFPGRYLVAFLPLAVPLVASGLRHAPRAGALAVALTIVATVWLWIAVRFTDAGLAADRPPAPWGPLEAAFPFFGDSAGAYIAAAGAALLAALLVARAEWSLRRPRGEPVLPPV